MLSKLFVGIAAAAAGVNAACTTSTPCSTCNVYKVCDGVQMISMPDLNELECTAAKIQLQRAAGVDTLGDRVGLASALSAAGCSSMSLEDYLKDEPCPVPSGANLDTIHSQMVASGVSMLAGTPSAAALQFIGQSCTDDCCQGGNPPATYCTTHTSCASFMSMKIPDTHVMALACMNNAYIFDRMINSSNAANAAAPLNAATSGAAFPMFKDQCKPLMTGPLPCAMGSLNFGWQNAVCCEAASTVAASEIMKAHSDLTSNVAFCPMHGADNGGCEADGITPTGLAFANAQANIMATDCECGNKIMAALTTTEKSILDKDGDDILDACSTTTTTTTTVAKKKDSSAAGLTVSLTALASAVLATVF